MAVTVLGLKECVVFTLPWLRLHCERSPDWVMKSPNSLLKPGRRLYTLSWCGQAWAHGVCLLHSVRRQSVCSTLSFLVFLTSLFDVKRFSHAYLLRNTRSAQHMFLEPLCHWQKCRVVAWKIPLKSTENSVSVPFIRMFLWRVQLKIKQHKQMGKISLGRK